MNLRGFLRQTTLWEAQVKDGSGDPVLNDWSEPTYAAPASLPARVEEKQRRVLNASGNEVLSETRVMLVDEVAVGDRLDGSQVQARESIVDVGGNTLGWTVFL